MKKLFVLAMAAALFGCAVNSYAKTERSQAAKNHFKHSNPCPSNGKNQGPCPGYIIDHINPIACGGADASSNMQWQTVADGKAKDKWERSGCGGKAANDLVYDSSGSGVYQLGSKGGCYTLSSSGKKRYVDHSKCGG